MTKNERIAALEARLAQVEARLAQAEANKTPYYLPCNLPHYPQYRYPYYPYYTHTNSDGITITGSGMGGGTTTSGAIWHNKIDDTGINPPSS